MEKINIQDYTYDLPPERIAVYPLPARDQSKLLVYHNHGIIHSKFDQVTSFLPENSVLFFNNTRVIPARLLFQKDSGAWIEIFLLSPAAPANPEEAMQSKGPVEWQCTIGNLKRWTPGMQLTKEAGGHTLYADLVDREPGIVKLSWAPADITFEDVLEITGTTPLPPYIHRPVETEDRERYQTVYSSPAGAVAAPTAGLHFTPHQLDELRAKGIITDFLTLHVSAGTFQPVKVQNALDHPMHQETVVVSAQNIRNLLLPDKEIVAVGTTALRTLESLYWYGVKLLKDPDAEFNIQKMDPYGDAGKLPTTKESLEAVAAAMKQRKQESMTGVTSIYIVPGYKFRICNSLITNFHQPGSTLILLVAAFVGADWKKIYRAALDNEYRFLSFGDSSLLIPQRGR